ncbi:MAG TPA: rRNA maturation RNAse YbeY [Kiritimatiellia bacterium]|nr:hypothetical protein [Lentisphaerota bacterium]HRV31520.1 rRNA maturation RNAse YbeY [Kiritimatiellia bacterium]
MKLRLINRQQALTIQAANLRRLTRELLNLAWPPPDAPPFAELIIVLTDAAAMPDYKARAFGQRRQTDVIAQSYQPVPGAQAAAAEIIINAELAAAEGRRRRGGPARELALYLAHGLDHLAGGRDDTPARKQRMSQREEKWLAQTESLWAEVIAP